MVHRDSIYRLENLIEFDDTYVDVKRTGKRGSGAAGKQPVLVAVETRKKITPPHDASEWLPLVHIVIGNMKTFINGTFHGVSSSHLQEYLDKFCYRFNRRFREPELPMRLLNACLAHTHR